MQHIFDFYYHKKRQKLSLVELNEDAIDRWLVRLQTLPFGNSCQQLFIMLLEILQLHHSIYIRAKLLNKMSSTILSIMTKLERYVYQQEYLKYDINYILTVNLFIGLRGLLIQNYFRLHLESYHIIKTNKISLWNIIRASRIKRIFLNSSKMILENFLHLIYQQRSLDIAYLKKQWVILHQVYANSLSLKLEKEFFYTTLMYSFKSNDAYSDIFISLKNSPNDAKISTIDLLYKQIIIFGLICKSQLNIEDIKQLYHYSKEWAEYVDLHENKEAEYKYKISFFNDFVAIENTIENHHIKADIYVYLERLIQFISFQYSYEKNISSLLNFRIQQVLLQSQERRYQRYSYFSNLDIYLGFYSAYRYLQRNDATQENRYDIIRYHAEVEDKSAKGYKAIWLDDIPKNLRSGEYILLKEQSDVESASGWQSGIIRRVSKMLDGKVELGIEVISLSQIVCEIYAGSSTYPVLLIYQHYIDKARWLLIFPINKGVPIEQRVELYVQQRKMQIYVSKALFTTQSFVQSEIKLYQQQDIDVLRAIFSEL